MQRIKKASLKIFLSATILLSGIEMAGMAVPSISYASGSGTITVSNVPNLKRTSPGEGAALGTVFITIPEYALKNGDQVTMSLPSGAVFHTPFDTTIEKDRSSLASLNGAFVLSGFDPGDLTGTVTSFGNNMVLIKVTTVGTPTGDFKLGIQLGDIDISGVSDGPLNLMFDAPSDSAFPSTTHAQGQTNSTTNTSSKSSISQGETVQNPAPEAKNSTNQNIVVNFTAGEAGYTWNGQQKKMDVAPYVNSDGRLLLPVRFIADAIGISTGNILWDSKTNTVTIHNGVNEVQFTVGSSSYLLNGTAKQMDTKTELRNNRVMIPIRYLANIFGTKISWDESKKTATISYSY